MEQATSAKTKMFHICLSQAVALLFLQLSLHSSGAVLTVPVPYPTVQSAINASSDGDEIILSPGRYAENIKICGKNIILRSTDPMNETVVSATVLDGNTSGSVVTFCGTELTTCVIAGLTITNGRAPTGGGINGNGTLATIQFNRITSNTAEGTYPDGRGGGLYGCNGTIKNNVIVGNAAVPAYSVSGGGLALCHGTIEMNTISGNSSSGWGGGLSECDGTIRNNIISLNSAYCGGGLSSGKGTIQNNMIVENVASWNGGGLTQCIGTILNNTISRNSASNGGGLQWCDAFIINCIIWENVAPDGSQLQNSSTPFYSCIQHWSGGGMGNITCDPRFVDLASGNYHLLPDSPCIDAGNINYTYGDYIVDIDGETRVYGNAVDIGADEWGSSLDSDGDLLADSDEANYGTNLNKRDTDCDGLPDGVEILRGTDPKIYNLPTGILIPADYPSVQQGIFFAFPLEEVILSVGTYYENIHLLGKDLTLRSADPFNRDIVSSTTIDGRGLFSVVNFVGKESKSCAVKGLLIRNGSSQRGGGIRGSWSHATIENNLICGNYGLNGGGLMLCNGNIRNNVISGNSSVFGGGLAMCNGVIENNTIFNNSADYFGGGMSYCWAGIRNCIIWQNSPIDAQLTECWTPSYCCIQNWTGGGLGNIADDPQLVDPDNGDFHIAPTSPCIDAGGYVSNVTYDFEGDLRPYNAIIEWRGDGSDFDIGADEYIGAVSRVENWERY